MGHPVLYGLLAAFIVSRVIRFRMRRRWRHAYGYGGGGCGGRFGFRRRGPIDLGAPDVEPRSGRRWGRWQRWGRWHEDARATDGAVKAAAPRDVAGSLELNQRQRELFDEVVTQAKDKLAAAELAEALSIIAREPFEREAVEFLVGKGELADDLEHLHFSLTAEQRQKLRSVASA
ncbi:MAG TPA: hypothetical protein VGL86_11320 [Polyangia bacterium]|jgi:hypothetical protein